MLTRSTAPRGGKPKTVRLLLQKMREDFIALPSGRNRVSWNAQNLQATFASCHHGQGLGGPLSTKYLALGTMGLDFHEKIRVRLAHHVPSQHDVRQGSNEEKTEQR